MTNEELAEFCKEHNGTEVKYICPNNRIEMDCIILLDSEKGISMKPIEDDTTVRAKVIEICSTSEYPHWLLDPSDDKFCMLSGDVSTLRSEIIKVESVCQKGVWNFSEDPPLMPTGAPSCRM